MTRIVFLAFALNPLFFACAYDGPLTRGFPPSQELVPANMFTIEVTDPTFVKNPGIYFGIIVDDEDHAGYQTAAIQQDETTYLVIAPKGARLSFYALMYDKGKNIQFCGPLRVRRNNTIVTYHLELQNGWLMMAGCTYHVK